MKTIVLKLPACLCAVLLLGGCAGVGHRLVTLEPEYFMPGDANLASQVSCTNNAIRIRNAKSEAQLKGLRYYRPAPYLLVYSNGKGSLNWEIHYLPDLATKASAQPYNVWSTLQMTLKFSDKGALMSSDETADSQVVLKQLIAAAEKIAPLVAKAFLNATEAPDSKLNQFPPPQLYKFVTENGVTTLKGGSVASLDALYSTPAEQ